MLKLVLLYTKSAIKLHGTRLRVKLLEKTSPLFQILRLKNVLVWQKIIARLGVMSEHKERERERLKLEHIVTAKSISIHPYADESFLFFCFTFNDPI